VIKRRQLGGWSLHMVQHRRNQPVNWF
jgi:hypothetical protein